MIHFIMSTSTFTTVSNGLLIGFILLYFNRQRKHHFRFRSKLQNRKHV